MSPFLTDEGEPGVEPLVEPGVEPGVEPEPELGKYRPSLQHNPLVPSFPFIENTWQHDRNSFSFTSNWSKLSACWKYFHLSSAQVT